MTSGTKLVDATRGANAMSNPSGHSASLEIDNTPNSLVTDAILMDALEKDSAVDKSLARKIGNKSPLVNFRIAQVDMEIHGKVVVLEVQTDQNLKMVRSSMGQQAMDCMTVDSLEAWASPKTVCFV